MTVASLKQVGRTSLASVNVPGLDIRLFAKMECENRTGSAKDRAAAYVIDTLLESGTIGRDTTLIESSSGNFGIALAAHSKLRGLKFVCVIDPLICMINEFLLRQMGAHTLKVTTRDSHGSYLPARIAEVRRFIAETPNTYWVNQYANPLNADAYYHTLAPELCEQAGHLDYVFVGVSSAGSINGVSRYVKTRFPAAKIVAVDVVGSVIFGQPPSERRIPGIGSSMVPPNLERTEIDDVVIVDEIAAIRACHELLREHALFVGGSSGAVFAAVKQYFAGKTFDSPPRVATIFADRGERYTSTIFDSNWCESVFASADSDTARRHNRGGKTLIYLGEKDIAALGIDWSRTIDVVEDAARTLAAGDFAQPMKPYLRYRDPGNRIIAMPGFLGGGSNVAGIKWIASFPGNIDRGIPRAHSTVVLNEPDTGRPYAIINTPLLSVIRTASVTGVVLRSYATARDPEQVQVGISGWGPIGHHHLAMAHAVLGRRLAAVRIFDIRPPDPSTLPVIDGVAVAAVSTWQEAYDDADVFMTCTVSRAPYVDRIPKPGSLQLNVSLRDYRASFCQFVKGTILVDDWDEVCRERTDVEMMHKEFGLQKEDTTSIAEFVTRDFWRAIPTDATVMFNPMGMAVFDLAIAAEYVKLASSRGYGKLLE